MLNGTTYILDACFYFWNYSIYGKGVKLTLIAGFCSLRYRPVPVTVPPVPTAATKKSILPPVSRQISGPVV